MKTSEDLSYWIKWSKNTRNYFVIVMMVIIIAVCRAVVLNLEVEKTPSALLPFMLIFLGLGILSDIMNKSLIEIDKRLKRLEKKDL